MSHSSRPTTAPSSLAPPRSIGGGLDSASDSDTESKSSLKHGRSQSHTSAGVSYADSPPHTPRSLAFNTGYNPFSPPASVRSFSSPDHSGIPGPHSQTQYPFPEGTPRSGHSSLTASTSDLPRTSSYISRPNTADVGSRPSSARREAFTSPPTRPLTIYGNVPPVPKIKKDRPKSTMLTEGVPPEKPWLESRDPYSRIAYLVTYAMVLLGIGASVVRVYFDYNSVRLMDGNLCPVVDEDFSGKSEEDIFGENGLFFREVDMSGFGNGEFDMTTASPKNSFVRNGRLYILPTLTSEEIGRDAVFDNHIYNITGCTFNTTRGWSYTTSGTSSQGGPQSGYASAIGADMPFDEEGYLKACSAVSNSSSGAIINPIQSARLSTRNKYSIKYGKVEVRAKIPTGDWMWPAIWMLPVDSVYGPWPMSGEIDIMEARGNDASYPGQGRNYVRSSLNWGPFTWLNGVWKTYGYAKNRFRSYNQDFHTYTLEWTEKFMRLSVDSRLHHMLDIVIDVPFFERGDFPPVIQNGSSTFVLQNPWINGTKSAPFDEKFYLILNLAVGGTNGWFPDNQGKKPWLDGSQTAMRQFALAQDQWLPTWPENDDDRAFVIDSVKMWQKC